MKKIILISGKSGSGKDTFANSIKWKLETEGQRVAITRYASHIKKMMTEIYGWNGIKDEWGRNKLQTLGTDIIREKFGLEDFHVSRTCEEIQFTSDDFDYYLIPDCRFPNEIEVPIQIFGKDKVFPIQIVRLNYDSGLTKEAQNHPSETSLDNYNGFKVCYITKTLDDVDRATNKLIETIMK